MPSFFICSLTSAIFFDLSFPENSVKWSQASESGNAGRSLQISETRSQSKSNKNFFPLRYSFSLLAWSIGKIFPSNAILLSSLKFAVSHSTYPEFTGPTGFTSSKPDPASSFSACIKYLESVHNPANESVIITVAADPVKPVSQAIIFQ